MPDFPSITAGKLRVSVQDGWVYISVLGECHEPGVREALDELQRFSEALNRDDVPHETYKRKKNDSYEIDRIMLKLIPQAHVFERQ